MSRGRILHSPLLLSENWLPDEYWSQTQLLQRAPLLWLTSPHTGLLHAIAAPVVPAGLSVVLPAAVRPSATAGVFVSAVISSLAFVRAAVDAELRRANVGARADGPTAATAASGARAGPLVRAAQVESEVLLARARGATNPRGGEGGALRGEYWRAAQAVFLLQGVAGERAADLRRMGHIVVWGWRRRVAARL